MTERDHAILAPSFLHIALKCPGAIHMKEGIPQGLPTEYSIKGTKVHDFSKDVLNDFLDHKLTGSDPDKHLKECSDDEFKKIAREYRDIIWEHAFESSITGKVYGVEEKLIWSKQLSLWGTGDFWLVATDERACPYGVVIDLKSGFVFVDADENAQLAGYACSLRKEVRSVGKDLDYVRAGIFQPFAEGEKYREVKFTAKQLDAWERKFAKLAEAVYVKKIKYKAGPHCKGCPGITACETHQKYLQKETGLEIIDAETIVFPEVKGLPTETLVKINKVAKQLTEFTKASKKQLLERMMAGEKVDGWKLVTAKTRRKWKEDSLGNLEIVLKELGVSLYESSARGITDLKEALQEQGCSKKRAEEVLNHFLFSPQGGVTLAESDDSRQEIQHLSGLFIDEE